MVKKAVIERIIKDLQRIRAENLDNEYIMEATAIVLNEIEWKPPITKYRLMWKVAELCGKLESVMGYHEDGIRRSSLYSMLLYGAFFKSDMGVTLGYVNTEKF